MTEVRANRYSCGTKMCPCTALYAGENPKTLTCRGTISNPKSVIRPHMALSVLFPRTLAQAEALEVLMKDMGIALDKVISLNVPDELIVGRVTGRKVCPACGASFHVEFNPPKVEGKCDYCGTELITRKDDNAETVTKRLGEYHSQTAPLFDFYKSRNLLVDIDGTKEVDAITQEIFAILG